MAADPILPELSFQHSHKQMPLVRLHVRTTLVKLPQARVLWSPGSQLTASQLRDAGDVTDIVAPNLLHTGGMAAAAAAHPRAKLWGVPGAREKAPHLPWHGLLTSEAWPHAPALACIPLQGAPRLNEVVAYHAASKTLLVGNLAFNLLDVRGLGARLIFSLFGTYRRFAMSRLLSQSVKDRAAFGASLAAVLALDFEHLVPTHGDVVVGGAKRQLQAALRERGLR